MNSLSPCGLLLFLSLPSSIENPALQGQIKSKETGVSIEVQLTPAAPADRIGLRWSPKGEKIALSREGKRLAGALTIGASIDGVAPKPIPIQLSRSRGSKYVNALWIDTNLDTMMSRGEFISTDVTERRGKFWSSFETTIPLAVPGSSMPRDYPISFWHVEDPEEADDPPVLRWSRRGWHQGEVLIDGKKVLVLITEARMDGIFDKEDAWSLSSDEATFVTGAGSHSLARHTWLGEQAFLLDSVDPHGRWIRFKRHNPGITRAEEERQEDVMAVDRNAERAPKPVAFLRSFEQASAQSNAEERPLLIDFETTWCGPCKQMDKWVYTSKSVVDAVHARKVVSLKVDGDDHKELKQRFKVEAYPTMILLAPDGSEERRVVGYQSVEEMTAFLVGSK